MYNVLISTGIAAALFLAILALGFGPIAAAIPAIIALFVANLLLARRIGQKIQELANAAQKEIAAQRIDKGIKLLESGFKYDRWQFLVGAELHSNIGILLYVKKDFDQARPHLQKAGARGPAGARAKAMLGCLAYMKKDEAAMRPAFELAVKAGKKESILWAIYAFCLDKLDHRDEALRVLARSIEANPSDEKLKASMVALQNEKKLKMKAYSPEWYQFHLEKPPADLGGGPGGRRIIYQRR
jgi:tetratricopeptide (TPR) repeat protein